MDPKPAMEASDQSKLLTLQEVAKRWNTSIATPRRLIQAERLPAINIGMGSRRACWRVRLVDVIALESALSTGHCTPAADDLSSSAAGRTSGRSL